MIDVSCGCVEVDQDAASRDMCARHFFFTGSAYQVTHGVLSNEVFFLRNGRRRYSAGAMFSLVGDEAERHT
jgi:hypothetical protein